LVTTASLWAYDYRIVEVPSAAMNKSVAVSVITPDSYVGGVGCYDVVYLLHGFGDDHQAWHIKGKVAPLADKYNLIFICPDGGKSWYWDSPVDASYRYETFVAEELVAWVDGNYRTLAERTSRAITGLSMGGHGALYLALRHQQTFGAAGSTSGGVDIRPFPEGWDIYKRLGSAEEHPENWEQYTVINLVDEAPTDGSLALIVDCGTEDFFYDVNIALHRKLMERGVPHDFYVRPGRHHWPYWQNSIQYQLLFFSNYFKNN
jgi:S-formylglutathione hydrolase FrmB